LAKTDLRGKYKFADEDWRGYAAPMSFHLAGRKLTVTPDIGEVYTLDFAPFPRRTVATCNAVYPYRCAKITDDIALVSFYSGIEGYVYAIDTVARLVTNVIFSEGIPPKISFGAWDGAAGAHARADDLDGNAVEWVFGGDSPYLVTYGGGGAQTGAPGVEIADFTAIHIAEGVYLQAADLRTGGGKRGVAILANFAACLAVGARFDEGGLAELGAYCRVKTVADQ
jgi:hypothetical protein